ncbi:hypothetical protein GOODEAATRI_021835 [Goodea atripinnis]|uniref:Uncharacterized protein n=1 Tax=Goodea atripinnis TaxID=208336 RepID=A0ABV0MLN0_9TELE
MWYAVGLMTEAELSSANAPAFSNYQQMQHQTMARICFHLLVYTCSIMKHYSVSLNYQRLSGRPSDNMSICIFTPCLCWLLVLHSTSERPTVYIVQKFCTLCTLSLISPESVPRASSSAMPEAGAAAEEEERL